MTPACWQDFTLVCLFYRWTRDGGGDHVEVKTDFSQPTTWKYSSEIQGHSFYSKVQSAQIPIVRDFGFKSWYNHHMQQYNIFQRNSHSYFFLQMYNWLITFSMNLKNVWNPVFLCMCLINDYIYSFLFFLCINFFHEDVYIQYGNKDNIYVYVFCKAFWSQW